MKAKNNTFFISMNYVRTLTVYRYVVSHECTFVKKVIKTSIS